MRVERLLGIALSCSIIAAALPNPAAAGPSMVVDASTGRVLEQEDATRPWYPASLTKLLTLYIALSAVRDGRVSMDTPFVISARAASMPPSNMGFPPGAEVTLENLLKMMMVHSANDLAVTAAEGLDGSVEKFADEMNAAAAKLGLKESHFVNPNGLPDPDHFSSARDLAMVALALFRDFPQYAPLYGIGAVKLGARIIPTHNNIMGRYPGIDGMKTGYTCAAGFNVVVSATRGGRHLIAVVLGSPTVKTRTIKTGQLLDAAFAGVLRDGPRLDTLASSTQTRPPDEHAFVCGPHKQPIVADEMPALPSLASAPAGGQPPAADEIYSVRPPQFEPEPVFVGPKAGWTGAVAAPIDGPAALPLEAYNSLNVTGEYHAPGAPVAAVARHRGRRGEAHRAARERRAESNGNAEKERATPPVPPARSPAPASARPLAEHKTKSTGEEKKPSRGAEKSKTDAQPHRSATSQNPSRKRKQVAHGDE